MRALCEHLAVTGGTVICGLYGSLGDVIGYTGETCRRCKLNTRKDMKNEQTKNNKNQ